MQQYYQILCLQDLSNDNFAFLRNSDRGFCKSLYFTYQVCEVQIGIGIEVIFFNSDGLVLMTLDRTKKVLS